MQLPRVKIQFLNGQLGTVGESPDGLMALICGASAVTGKFELNTVYPVTSMDDLVSFGVTEVNNATLYKQVKEFYDEAESGTKLILYPVAANTKVTDLCDYTKLTEGFARDLITRQNGALRGIGVAGINTGSTSVSNNGLESDVFTALPKAQQLAEWATSELYAPLFFMLEGRNYDASKELKDLTGEKYNRVAVVISDTVSDSKGACIGTLLGRISSIPVQRNIGRVKDGSLFPLEMYIGTKKIEESGSTISTIFEKGYIVPRKHVGRTGYYFSDDQMACDPTDDYAHITNRRVIDKAYRICHDTMLEELLDEIDLNEDGTMQHAVVKSWQQTLENAINRKMTANGELSATDGEGCKVYINEKQNVVSTSRIELNLKVRPHGYARYIDVNIGFLVTTV